MMSLISLERVLFSLRTSSSWSMVSSYADLILKRSEEALRVSFWLTSRSKDRRSTLPFHSPITLSNCLAFLSMAALRTWAWSRLLVISLISEAILPLAFSTWFSLAFRLSIAASASVKLVLEVPVLAQKKSPLASLVVAQGLHIVQLGGEGGLLLGKDVQVVVKVANNAEEIRVLTSDLVLVGGKVSQSKVGIVNLLVDGIQSLQHLFVGHVSGGLGPHHLVSGSAGVSDLVHDENLVLLDL